MSVKFINIKKIIFKAEKYNGKTFLTQAIHDEILGKLSLKNRYSFLNNNIIAILSSKEFNFLKEVEKFCARFEKKNSINLIEISHEIKLMEQNIGFLKVKNYYG